jgi:hypothetical protein
MNAGRVLSIVFILFIVNIWVPPVLSSLRGGADVAAAVVVGRGTPYIG